MLFAKPVEGTQDRILVGRIESVDRHTDSDLSRHTFIIDAVDADFDFKTTAKPTSQWDRKAFSIIRIMTTAQRFSEIARRPEFLETPEDLVGQWVALHVGPRSRVHGPLAQVCPLGDLGYDRVVKYGVEDIEFFETDPEFPRSVGAAGNSRKQLAASLFKAGQSYNASTSAHQLVGLRRKLRDAQPKHVRVLDVGHANFISVISDDGAKAVHFDVGWPIAYNMHTAPITLPNLDLAEVVILSHWDWDHLHGYHVWSTLKDCIWVTPVQDLGPGAFFVASSLNANGKLLSIGPLSSRPNLSLNGHGFIISYANPRHAIGKSKMRNNSGLILTVTLSNGKVALLPGDADYMSINWANSVNPDLLVVSHHGAAVQGSIQAPKIAGSVAVLSLGAGNVYRHPCGINLKRHTSVGWSLRSTCVSPHRPRGDCILV